jgi:hypothetical protein
MLAGEDGMVEVGAVVMGDGVVEVGTVETEPVLVSVLGSGCLAGRWLRLPTIQHPITQHPATATPLLQSPPPLGTGAIHISNITHM